MAKTSYEKLTSLGRLARRLTTENAGGLLIEILDLLLDGSRAEGGLLLLEENGLNVVAERITASGDAIPRVRGALTAAARDALVRHQPRLVPDVLGASPPLPGVGELVGAGIRSLLVVPVEHFRTALGAVVLTAADEGTFDPSSLAFVEAAANTVALAIHRDRGTELEQVRREELAETNRMAGLGLLTASVAHELRGPVGALVLQIEEQRRVLEDALGAAVAGAEEPLLRELGELTTDIETALARIRGTVDQLSRLSRRDSELAEIDLADVVLESLTIARPYLKRRGITLTEDITPGGFVRARRDNLGQVLLNLVFNAADACEQSGTEPRQIGIVVRASGERVLLQVDDTGAAIPPDQIKATFALFSPVKPRGRGSGMGLRICSDVVTAHGGHIEVVNRPEGGASFRVMLPLARPASFELPEVPEPRAGGGRQRIVVIDDDPVFTRSMVRGLKDCEVRTAPTASEAEIALAEPGYRPDLVLCDIYLPGLNGHLLHARLRRHDPELAARFVFITGGALTKEEADYLRTSGCPTLFKPLNLDDIHAMLGAHELDPTRRLRTLGGGLTFPPDSEPG